MNKPWSEIYDEMQERVETDQAVYQRLHAELLPMLTSEQNEFLKEHLRTAYIALIDCDAYMNVKRSEIVFARNLLKDMEHVNY